MSNRAWVTLATNDSYGVGALVLAHSLRRAGSKYPAVVLITPSVTDAMRDRLGAVFAEVITVDVLDSHDASHLALLQRPELGITFTKIHCWNLTQYEKCVFLDADILVVQNCDELFDREELSAAPDVGWPDCFNSGVFVFKPSPETFSNIIKFAQERGSFDGGDQGLLNSYFSDWAHADINKRLPFLYNVTSAAFYSYIPALKHYGQDMKIIHFIGAGKPWLQHYNWTTHTVDAPEHLRQYLQAWWDLFVTQVHCQLDTSMVETVEAPPRIPHQDTDYEPTDEPLLNYGHYEPTLDPDSEFPWHHPDNQITDSTDNEPKIDITEFYDPWKMYRGHILPNTSGTDNTESVVENYEEVRKNAWENMPPQFLYSKTDSITQHINRNNPTNHYEISQYSNKHPEYQNTWQENSQENLHNEQNFSHDDSCNYTAFNKQPNQNELGTDYNHLSHSQPSEPQHNVHDSYTCSDSTFSRKFHENLGNGELNNIDLKKQHENQHVYSVHVDHRKRRNENAVKHLNGYVSDDDSEISEDYRPRHPYDGFYLRHQMTIDSHGRKICTHEIPLSPLSSPPASPELYEDASAFPDSSDELNGESHTGVAGTFAKVVPGTAYQKEAEDELTRRQGWESGNIDYMGADSFDNIIAKISQTLNQPPSPPPQQSSPPKEQPPQQDMSVQPIEPAVSATETPVVQEAPKTVPDTVVQQESVSPIVDKPAIKETPASPVKTPVEESIPVPVEAAAVEISVPADTPAAPSVEEKTDSIPSSEVPVSALKALELEETTSEILNVEPATAVKSPEPKSARTPEPTQPEVKSSGTVAGKPVSDSPPLANTPSKEDIPVAPAAKSEERRKPAGKLQLSPPVVTDPSPTPDSELEDADSLAQSIIASEMRVRTPTVTSPSPPVISSTHAIPQHERLAVQDPEVPTPPVGSMDPVSLSQIGIKPKAKPTIASQIESSVSEKTEISPTTPGSGPASPPVLDAPRKKVVKKTLKKDKEGSSSSEAPVPPPRKKEKKPKEK